ncbi:MAG: MFS transporter [Firmicutes bacterium]|nr:MFS transporter [Bacillota bacterium]
MQSTEEVRSPFVSADRARFGIFQWRSLFTSGMGVFTDGYDLSSIAIVLPLILKSYGITHLIGWQSSFLVGSSLIGAAVGALLFGILANRGRKKYYGFDMILMTVGALWQGIPGSILALLLARTVIGLGSGADYVLSPLIMAEHSNAKDRGKTFALGFGLMWSLGSVTASLVYMVLMAAHVAPDLVWRIVLAFGAVPSASVIYLRRKVPETARYLGRVADQPKEMQKVIQEANPQDTGPVALPQSFKDTTSFATYFKTLGRPIFVASLLWFLCDVVGYSGNLFGPSLLAKGVGLSAGTFGLVMFFVFALPGKALGTWLIDRWGRKPLQIWGAVGEALSLFLFAWLRQPLLLLPVLGLVVYGMNQLLGSFGPGLVSTSGIVGVELAPTKIRSMVQAITVASGRIGAALTAFVFPALFLHFGESFAIVFLGGLTIVIALVTQWGMRESKQLPLETAAQESLPLSPAMEMRS